MVLSWRARFDEGQVRAKAATLAATILADMLRSADVAQGDAMLRALAEAGL